MKIMAAREVDWGQRARLGYGLAVPSQSVAVHREVLVRLIEAQYGSEHDAAGVCGALDSAVERYHEAHDIHLDDEEAEARRGREHVPRRQSHGSRNVEERVPRRRR